MKLKDLLQKTLNHQQPDRIFLDMDSSPTKGNQVHGLENIEKYYGLESYPIRAIEPNQMLDRLEEDLF